MPDENETRIKKCVEEGLKKMGQLVRTFSTRVAHGVTRTASNLQQKMKKYKEPKRKESEEVKPQEPIERP